MIAPRCQRPVRRLRELLEGRLDDQTVHDITQHLDQCESCRQQMEQLAAGQDWWQEARDHLSSGELAHDPSAATQTLGTPRGAPLDVAELVRGFLAPSDQPGALGMLDSYQVLKVIGCGGMGIVFKGFDPTLDRYVAIKVLAPHYATSAAAKRRFAREAQAAAAVVHPHVLAIHGVSGNSPLPYLVMPLVTGPSLQQRIDQVGPLEIRDVLRIGLQAAQGLAAAHAQGLVHRDVKPANILLEHGLERVLLTDFGLARAIDDASLTYSGMIAGTPQFMSPEQARGDAVDHQTDLFSLGSVLYTMCAGRPPFRAETTLGVMRRICDDPPRPLRDINPDVPAWLADLIARLMAKDKQQRYQSADEVADVLEQCLAHVQHPTSIPLPAIQQLDTVERKATEEQTTTRSWFWPSLAAVSLGLLLIVLLWTRPWAALLPAAPGQVVQQPGSAAAKQSATAATTATSSQDPRWDDPIAEEIQTIRDALQRLDNELEW